MKAMVLKENGGPEVFELRNLPKPVPKPGQVLVRVHAAAVNPIDYKIRKTGAFGLQTGAILGFDVAGVVESIGPGVHELNPGDAVFFSPDFSTAGGANGGGYAEYAIGEAGLVCRKPVTLSFEQAAAIPLAGMTAYQGVFERAGLKMGQAILICAAAGGVGSMAVQLARAAGAYIFAVCSSASVEFVKSLGAQRVIDYKREDFVPIIKQELPEGLDLVYDCAGQNYIVKSLDLMKPFGNLVTIVNPAGELAAGYRKNVTLHYQFMQRKKSTLEALRVLLERGQIKPHIDLVLPLEKVSEAHSLLEKGGVKGKIILQV